MDFKSMTPPPSPLPVNGEGEAESTGERFKGYCSGTMHHAPTEQSSEFVLSGVRLFVLIMTFLLFTLPVMAQEQPPTRVVTADEVNDIASRLYCPVCENIPLDTCPTAACADWRYEIQLQLEAGKTEPEIVNDFVTRFGDRVVGTPLDPTLRALSLITPYILMGVVMALLLAVITQWRKGVRRTQPTTLNETPQSKYYELLEKDLEG